MTRLYYQSEGCGFNLTRSEVLEMDLGEIQYHYGWLADAIRARTSQVSTPAPASARGGARG